MCRKNVFSFSYEFPFILSSNQHMACCVFCLFVFGLGHLEGSMWSRSNSTTILSLLHSHFYNTDF